MYLFSHENTPSTFISVFILTYSPFILLNIDVFFFKIDNKARRIEKGRIALTKEVEIEFKNMLTKVEFDRLVDFFQVPPSAFITQHNHYFDTPSFDLKEKGAALRIREKNGAFELTLKQPHPNGLLETNEPLTKDAAEAMLTEGKFMTGEVAHELEKMNISLSTIKHFGTLSTDRAELTYKNGLLVLDHSYYLSKEDFEIEYEVTDPVSGKQAFDKLLQQLAIPTRPTKNKVRRFYEEKYRQLQADRTEERK
jgi:uncharacterized protein YjbK